MKSLAKILLVDDDRSIAAALAQALKNEYDVDIAATGKLALYKTDLENYQLIILDLNLPDIPGLNVCQQLRQRGVTTSILILSGESRVLTKIHLLDAGANDYLTKPFSLGELKARMRSLARYSPPLITNAKPLQVDDLTLNSQTYEVQRAGQPIFLRRKEFALLECLMEYQCSVVRRETLTRLVWADAGDVWTNTVDVHIKHLRDKVDKPFDRQLIKTVHGLGYKIEATQPALMKSN